MGASLAEHRAQPLTARLIEQADAIFAMDFQNKAELLTRYPEHREKIHLLSAYGDGAQRYREIADPRDDSSLLRLPADLHPQPDGRVDTALTLPHPFSDDPLVPTSIAWLRNFAIDLDSSNVTRLEPAPVVLDSRSACERSRNAVPAHSRQQRRLPDGA